MKILLVEDDETIADSIMVYLRDDGFICEFASTFTDAEEKIHTYEYDLIIVDIMLPDGTGFELVKQLKQAKSKSGIIVISARDGVNDKILGLDLGADDYVTKPFHLAELNARIKSVIRRRNFDGDNEIIFREIKINPDSLQVTVNGKLIELTKKEHDLLMYFIANKGRVLTKESIAEHLWGDNIDEADSFDFIYTHIKNVRKKIVEQGGVDYIKTVYGMGYKFG
ncbi:response regulator transcription factor [candidate division KSB1 bacterium]|nr:response regulator transcription factor [candidate division KSB1 bacterium]